MSGWSRFRTRIVLLMLAALVTGGCSGARPITSSAFARSPGTTSKEELRDALNQFEDNFEATIQRAADELTEQSPTPRVRRLVLIWQMQLFPKARKALDQSNPVASFLDLWTLCLRMVQFLDGGDGKSLFGERQEIAVRAARECEAQIERVGHLFLTSERAADARKKVDELARSRPLHGEFSGADIQTALESVGEDNALKNILAIPMVPFRALEAADRTAESVRGFTVVAARLTDVVQGLAADGRLQFQLLMLQTEEHETVQKALASFQQLSESSKRLSNVAEKLPKELRDEVAQAIDDINAKTGELRTTLKEAQLSAEKIEKAGQSAALAGDALARTAQAIQAMVASFRSPAGSQEPPGEKKGPPFDINDYTKSAEAFGAAARELHTLADEIRGLSGTSELAQRMDNIEGRLRSMLQSSEGTGRSMTDHLAWRGLQLIIAAFLLAIIYRIVTTRYVRS